MEIKDGAVVDENNEVGRIVLDSEKVKVIRLIISDELHRQAKIKMTEIEKKQANCPYCHSPYKTIANAKYWDEMNVALDRDNRLHEWGANGIGKNPTPINYCPMCGRKLGEDE